MFQVAIIVILIASIYNSFINHLKSQFWINEKL